jgi:ABC-type uncharacterized transport system ATPase subunit
MRDVVEIAREGRTVLFSTHVMERVERCDRIAIIARRKGRTHGYIKGGRAGGT